jgi:enterochelin esterase-like enzyme
VAGAAILVGGGATAAELVSHGLLPGKQSLDRLEGGCSVTSPEFRFSALGPAHSGTFYSNARGRTVGYTLAFPPGHASGDPLPLVVMLHGFGGNHTDALAGMTPAQAVAIQVDGKPLPPMALVTVDGGGGYWNPHPGDDPMAMVVDELIPLCQSMGAGRPPASVGMMGISMGGYGALLIAERYPKLVHAVAAISPAVWTDYDQARSANPGAYASATAFASCDVVTHASALERTPVRIASGADDPFHPGVEALAASLPSHAIVDISEGCHTGPFFASQEPASLTFLAGHLGQT